MLRNFVARSLIVSGVIFSINSVAGAQFLRPRQINDLPSTPYDDRIQYGKGNLQFGDLRLPKRKGKLPVAVVIHGGCWRDAPGADVENTAPLASALTALGIATWNIEYRRVDNEGGGWPGTFDDVASAVDHLKALSARYRLDLGTLIIVGHSAGGHLGTWAAARHRLPTTSPLYTPKPLRVRGVVNLAGAEPAIVHPLETKLCGQPVVSKLLGGTPTEVPERYRQASAATLLPIDVRQILITGAQDPLVLPEWGRRYAAAAKAEGDDVEFQEIQNAAHFEVIAPGSVAWPAVKQAVLSLVNGGR